MLFRWWCGSVLRGIGCELQVVCEWAFGVCSSVMRQRWLVGFVSWWCWALRLWNLVVRRRRWRCIGVELMVRLFERRLLPLLLLAKDFYGVVELFKPRSLSIYMLPSSFSMLSYGLPTSDGLLFLVKVLNLLMNPS
jgi:hypothetical protein